MLAPIRPTPTNPILEDFIYMSVSVSVSVSVNMSVSASVSVSQASAAAPRSPRFSVFSSRRFRSIPLDRAVRVSLLSGAGR